MKNIGDGLIKVILIAVFMSYIGYDFIKPAACAAKDEKALREAKTGAETKAATETMASPKAKKPMKAAPAKKSLKKALAPVVTVVTPVAILAKKLSLTIIGAGYEPDEELSMLFADAEGMQTNIVSALDPPLKANKAGAWSTTWTVDDFIAAKLVTTGVFTLTVTDNEYKPLAQTVIAFKEAPKPDAREKKSVEDRPSGGKAEKKSKDK